jgi:hypothetical protein
LAKVDLSLPCRLVAIIGSTASFKSGVTTRPETHHCSTISKLQPRYAHKPLKLTVLPKQFGSLAHDLTSSTQSQHGQKIELGHAQKVYVAVLSIRDLVFEERQLENDALRSPHWRWELPKIFSHLWGSIASAHPHLPFSSSSWLSV